MATATITANLNGGDSVTTDDNLVFKIYGATDSYAAPIHTTGAASTDADVSIVGDVVTITGVDVGVEADFKITSVDQALNESELSDAYSIAEADLVAELGAKLLAWEKDSTDVANLTQDGTKASAWLDASGNNLNAVQATSTKQPLLDADGLLFDGDDDVMTLSFGSSLSTFELHFLVKIESVTALDRILDFLGTNRFIIRENTATTLTFYSYINTENVDVTISAGEFALCSLIIDGASSSFNGSTIDIGGAANVTSVLLANRTEGTAGGNIILKELVLTDLLTSGERTAVINRLNSLI